MNSKYLVSIKDLILKVNFGNNTKWHSTTVGNMSSGGITKLQGTCLAATTAIFSCCDSL